LSYQYTYHIEYLDTTTGIKSTWNSRQHNKRAAIEDFTVSFGDNYEVLKAFLPSALQIERGISEPAPQSTNQPSLFNYYARYCPVCLETMAHRFLDYEHPLNDLLDEDYPPMVRRLSCVRCSSIRIDHLNND